MLKLIAQPTKQLKYIYNKFPICYNKCIHTLGGICLKNIKLDKSIDKPLYIQLYERIKISIEEEKFQSDKLPSIRSLSKSLGVNNVTVVSAYKLLESEGYVYSLKGSGTYIKKSPLEATGPYLEEEDIDLMNSGILHLSEDSINFASVSPTPDLFPIDNFKKTLMGVLDRDGGHAFLYPEVTGYEPLRESISKFLVDNYETRVNKDNILITAGGQQGLDIIAKTLISPGDYILVENPTYSAALSAFKSRGAKIIGVPMLENGIDIDVLKSYINRYRPKFIYIMTNFQSPTTYSYSQYKKEQLIDIVNNNDIYIIEDDFLTDLYFKEKKTPLKSMDKGDKIIFIKSFSKVFMPGVRIGFVTLPRNIFTKIIKAKHTTDVTSSGYLQRAFDLYLRNGFWNEHIENIRSVYKRKYNLVISLLGGLEKYGISYTKPDGGLSIWLTLPDEIDSLEFYKECNENKVALIPGKIFFVDSNHSNSIRFSYGAVDDDEIVKGIHIMENIISKYFKDKSKNYMPFV